MNGQNFSVAVKEPMKVNTFVVTVKEPRKGSRLPACRQVTFRSLNTTDTLTFYSQRATETFVAGLIADGYTQIG